MDVLLNADPMKLRLKELLAEKNMKQVTLAERVGVEKGYVSELVSGKKIPSIPTLERIADALGVGIIELIADDRSALERELIVRFRSLSPDRQQALLQFLGAQLEPEEAQQEPASDRLAPELKP